MIFATYQSNAVVEQLNATGRYENTWISDYESGKLLREKVGFNPVFAIPFDDYQNFLTMSLILFPALPNNLVIFESNEAIEIDTIAWNEVMTDPGSRSISLIMRRKKMMTEHILPSISNVLDIIHLNDHPYESISDIYFDELFNIYPELFLPYAQKYGAINTDLHVNDVAKIKNYEMARFNEYLHRVFGNPTSMTKTDVDDYLNIIKTLIFVNK